MFSQCRPRSYQRTFSLSSVLRVEHPSREPSPHTMASASPAVQRLHQTLQILDPAARPQGLQLSLVHGPVDPPLLNFTIGELLDFQADKYHDREALVVSWTGTRWTYGELKEQSLLLARGMLSMGIKPGDRIAIMAGNCEEYVAVFFAAARIGAILVVLNNTYTATEATYALNHTGMWATEIGTIACCGDRCR